MSLGRFLAWLDRLLAPGAQPGSSGFVAPTPVPLAPSVLAAVTPMPEPWRSGCFFSVDDAGQFLLVSGARLTLGHVRSGLADLLFLADVGPLHAELVREDSLHAGPGWCLRALRGERAEVEGEPIPPEGRRLVSGQRVRLAGNLAFRFECPDPSSESACLALEAGLECCGARKVLLLGEGEGGRLRLGPARERHVRVTSLEYEVVIEKRGERLWVRSSREGVAEETQVVHFPPPRRVDLALGAPRGSRPPFGFSFEPLVRPPLARERDPGG
jgi:hypothetical protein